MRRLTEKQRKFCEAFAKTEDVCLAARSAGYHALQESKLREIGMRNVEKFQNEINRIKQEQVADEGEVLAFFSKVMRREHCDFSLVMQSREEAFYTPDEKGIMRKRSVKERKAEIVEVPVKLSEARYAAEMLGKRYGLFKAESRNERQVGVIEVEIYDDEKEGWDDAKD